MKLLVMMKPGFKDYDKFKKELDKLSPNVHELVYYANRDQASWMCEKYSKEEFEMPTHKIKESIERNFGAVAKETTFRAAEYADALLWFHDNQGIVGGTSGMGMEQRGKKVIFVDVS